jgi:hypothetical protein
MVYPFEGEKPGDLVRIKNVYGDRLYVRAYHLATRKHQVPLYHSTGESYNDRIERTGRNRGSSITIHVDNIVRPI